jgi:hypothetical protein
MNRLTDFSGIDPERTAVRIGAEDLSYRRFDDDIARMTHWLVQQGLQPLQRWVRARIPKKLSFTQVNMPSIPRNDMGKVSRRELAEKNTKPHIA